MYIVRSEEGGGDGAIPSAFGRINVYLVGIHNTRGARSRPWCGWRARTGRGGIIGATVWMARNAMR